MNVATAIDQNPASFDLEGEEARIAEANRRLAIVESFLRMLKGDPASGTLPMAPRAAYSKLKKFASRASVDRYVQKYQASGGDFNALIPGTDRCGRTSTADKLNLTEKERAEISGLRLDTGSTTAALRAYAQSDRCRQELSDAILDASRTSKHSIPPSIRAAVTTNKAIDNAHRGPRALSLRGMWTPRKNDILPGDIFTSDDTTPIWAWWVPWRDTEKQYQYGAKVLQGQFLPIMDVASQCVVAFALIAREASSYRACDIWSLFGHTFDTIGLPRLGFQLERGSWEANVIRGSEVDIQERRNFVEPAPGRIAAVAEPGDELARRKAGREREGFSKNASDVDELPAEKQIDRSGVQPHANVRRHAVGRAGPESTAESVRKNQKDFRSVQAGSGRSAPAFFERRRNGQKTAGDFGVREP
jgi:hypothetical protein